MGIWSYVGEQFNILFTKAALEDEFSPMEKISRTIVDWFENVIEHKIPNTFSRRLAMQCLQKVVQCYVSEIFKKKKENFTDEICTQMEKDEKDIRAAFTEVKLREKVIDEHLLIIKRLISMASGSITSVTINLED